MDAHMNVIVHKSYDAYVCNPVGSSHVTQVVMATVYKRALILMVPTGGHHKRVCGGATDARTRRPALRQR